MHETVFKFIKTSYVIPIMCREHLYKLYLIKGRKLIEI